MKGTDEQILDWIRKSKTHGNLIMKHLVAKTPGWNKTDGIVTWYKRIYVPRDPEIRVEIIQLNHDITLIGHPGQAKMYELITHNYWWPQLHTDIMKYVSRSETCQ